MKSERVDYGERDLKLRRRVNAPHAGSDFTRGREVCHES